ncbi:MAG: peptidoglycan DD-metalloendopeptidase family protein [Candidatus Aminicenantes bacterium]|nr:peptidoglycan DD-metalloendopeptidase family protein [Candidatus Aminicenantes bacterium]
MSPLRAEIYPSSSWPSFYFIASVIISLLISVLFSSWFFPLHAQQSSSAAADVENKLNEINRQIEQIKSRLAEEQRKESSLLNTLEKIRLNKRLLQKEIESLNLRRAMVMKQQSELTRNISATRKSLEREREAVERTLITLYKYGRLDFMHFFLKANNLETLLRESKNLTFLARYQGEAVNRYLNTLSQLQAMEAELQKKKSEAENLLRQTEENMARLSKEEKENQKVLEQIKKNKAIYQQMMVELQESREQLKELLQRLQNQEISLPSPFIPMYEKKGKLPWPLTGKIITRFGPERHPKFKTVTINNGIEIQPAGKERTIKAVHGGRVVFADYFQGYGNLIIIDHGLSYYSLYGHCSSFLVKVGDLVQPEQPIAVVGDSDSLKGECLYFEIRHKTQAANPLQWLKRR